MQKVSMRHLNEIVRERNQYSRDASEAWQDFINYKSRQDTELAKVTKRNNFLVEELESWKQQFLKFQAFAEQLTKETQDLKVKIEGHKRENRRLAALSDQNKDDMQRLTTRLTGTEKQRDDALEALVLQQEIAEELERERKRNKKELAAAQTQNANVLRQRDEAHRSLVGLRALIEGQSEHMEHVVQSIHKAPELQNRFEQGSDSAQASEGASESASVANNRLSMNSVADKYLREKTDSISYIIRNITEQCAAAVDGLQIAQRADGHNDSTQRNKYLSPEDGVSSEMADDETNRTDRMSIPPTPDLIHNNRASTAMSYTTEATTVRDMESVPDLPNMHKFEPQVVGEQNTSTDEPVLSKGFPVERTLEGDRMRGMA